MKTEPNDAAYPLQSQFNGYLGLTKREYFAALAMQGLLANGAVGGTVQDAVSWADALIAALNEK